MNEVTSSKKRIADLLSHPLVLLIATSILSTVLVPYLVEQFKESELRLVNRSARAVKLLADVQLVEKAALDVRLLFDRSERLSRDELTKPDRDKLEIDSIRRFANLYAPGTADRKKLEKLASDAEKIRIDNFVTERLSGVKPWSSIYVELEAKIAAYRLAGGWAQSIALESLLVKDFSKEEHEGISKAAAEYSKAVDREYLLHHYFFRELEIALTEDGITKVAQQYDEQLRELRRRRNDAAVELLAIVSATKGRPSDLLLLRY